MAEPCSCEEAMALRAEIETLRRGEGCHHPSCCRAVEKERDALRDQSESWRRAELAWQQWAEDITEAATGDELARETIEGRLTGLRELARELMAVAERIGTDADLWIEGEQLLARAKALGVEVGR